MFLKEVQMRDADEMQEQVMTTQMMRVVHQQSGESNNNNNNINTINTNAHQQQQQQQPSSHHPALPPQQQHQSNSSSSHNSTPTCGTCESYPKNCSNKKNGSSGGSFGTRSAAMRMVTLRRLYQRLLPHVPIENRCKVRTNRRPSVAHFNPSASEAASGERLVTQDEIALAASILGDAVGSIPEIECLQCRRDLYVLSEFVLPLMLQASMHEWSFSSFALIMHGAARVNPDFADMLTMA